MKIVSLLSTILSAALVSGFIFDPTLKTEYSVGETLEVSIVNNYDEHNWMVGIPSVSISLYDESGTTMLYTITELIQLKKFPPLDKSDVIEKWAIPEEIDTQYKTDGKFSLVIDYLQSKRGSAKPLSFRIEHPITIKDIRSTGTKAMPPAQPRKSSLASETTGNGATPEKRVEYSATWGYNMIKSLLVNHLL
ncbi:hypothetical protein K7432_003744 [Basidiobolus ranarum]|uniref:Uncharacterized protein n=1 Tax=Basidiobolus ranarum TaxID=34480 RepID=A0ABR2W605_9FUNG